MMFAVFDVFAWYSSALHNSLAPAQGFSFMIMMHNFTALKENGITEDIFFLNVEPWWGYWVHFALYIAFFNQFGSNTILDGSIPSPPNASL